MGPVSRGAGSWRTAIGQVVVVTAAELRLLVQGRSFWLILLVAGAIFAPSVVGVHQIVSWQDDNGIGLLIYASAVVSLGGALLVVPTYQRDLSSGMAPLIFVRPIPGELYIVGKFLASVAIMTIIALLSCGFIVIFQATGHGAVGLPILVALLLAVFPSILFSSLLCMLAATVLRRMMLGYLLVVAFTALCGVVLTQSLITIFNPFADALTYHNGFGFGQDLALLLANRAVYGATFGCLFFLLILAFQRIERRAQHLFRAEVALVGAVGAAAISVLLWHSLFVPQVRAVVLSDDLHSVAYLSAKVRDYRLTLQLNPQSGEMGGVAQFSLVNSTARTIGALPFYLNDGLAIVSALANGRAQRFVKQSLFTTVRLTVPLPAGGHLSFRVRYHGFYKLLRAEYGRDQEGVLGTPTDLSPVPLHQSYVAQGAAMLLRDGDWYPLPWIEALAHQAPAALGWRAVQVHAAASVQMIASTAVIRRAAGEQVATWTLDGYLPSCLLVVPPPSYRAVAVLGGIVYLPASQAQAVTLIYAPYVAALHDLAQFFQGHVGPVRVVVTPLVQGSGAVHVHAAVSGDLAIVPLDSLDMTPEGAQLSVSQLPDPAPYRAALDDLAVAWWADRLPQELTLPTTYPPSIDLPSGYVSVAEVEGKEGDDPTHMLAGYTGALVAAQREGHAFFAGEMSLRERALRYVLDSRSSAPMIALQIGGGPLDDQLAALGLLGRLVPFDATPALYRLGREVGARRLAQILVLLSQTRDTPYAPESVTCALARATGRPFVTIVNSTLHSPYNWTQPLTDCA